MGRRRKKEEKIIRRTLPELFLCPSCAKNSIKVTIDPKNKLIEPVTNWLIKNRRGAQWSNTRDTAIVVLAMNDYLRVSDELKPELEYELIVNGKSIAKKQVSGTDVFNAPSRFAIDPKLVKDANQIRIVRKKGGLLFQAGGSSGMTWMVAVGVG